MYVPQDEPVLEHGEVNLAFSGGVYDNAATGTSTHVTTEEVMHRGAMGAVNPIFTGDAEVSFPNSCSLKRIV